MALTKPQKKLAKKILKVGRKRGASKQALIAAMETARVEANFSNPAGGDGTSVGWRQEIDSYGSAKRRMNVKGAAKRFFSEAAEIGDRGSAGELAQAVQKSAYPDRYGEHQAEAKSLVKSIHGGVKKKADKKKSTTTSSGPSREAIAERHMATADYFRGPRDHDSLIALASTLRTIKAKDSSQEMSSKDAKTGGRHGHPEDHASKGAAGAGAKVGGGWDGTEKLVKSAVKKAGGSIGSTKRTPEENRAVGGSSTSDHLTTNKSAFAVDTDASDAVAKNLAKRFGFPTYKGLQTKTIKIGGQTYRIQLIWQAEGHYDHVHFGAHRV